MIVNIHGGPHGQNGPGFNFKNQVYGAHGWATLNVNFRGSTGYGQKFADAVFGDQNLIGVTGARAATAHWPLDGVLPADADIGIDGYSADTATLRQLTDALASDADLDCGLFDVVVVEAVAKPEQGGCKESEVEGVMHDRQARSGTNPGVP